MNRRPNDRTAPSFLRPPSGQSPTRVSFPSLHTLRAHRTQVVDATPLQNLFNLESLTLNESELLVIDDGMGRHLKGLTSARHVSLYGNPSIPCADLMSLQEALAQADVHPQNPKPGVDCTP